MSITTSALPWKFVRRDDGDCHIETANGETVCSDTEFYPEAPSEKQMQFMVSACNAHNDLVKACEISLQYVEAICFNTPNEKKRRNYADCARIIREALAKAGAQEQPPSGTESRTSE